MLPTSPKPSGGLPDEGTLLAIIQSCPTTETCAEKPVHVLVAQNSRKRTGCRFVYHRSKIELAQRSYRQLTGTISLCSPELVFVQLAKALSLPQLIAVGFELCGCYPADTAGQTKAEAGRRSAVSTASDLVAFTEKATAAKGAKKARRAAAYVIDGSASPMETAIAMELSLPCSLGGRGLPKPLLNHKVQLDDESAILARRRHLIFDLFWPEAKVAIEYDSKMHHESYGSRISDSQKRASATRMGIQVISITERQYLNMLEFEELAKTVAKLLDVRIRPSSPDYTQRAFKLRSELRGLYSPTEGRE